MPSIVSINTTASNHSATEAEQIQLEFDVANTSGRGLKLRVRLLGSGDAPLPGWLNLSEGSQLNLEAAAAGRVSVTAAPGKGSAGNHQFRLEGFEIALPEENVDRSAPVTITVAAADAPVEEPDEGRPGWIIPALIAGIVAIALIGGGVWYALQDPGPDPVEIALMPNLQGMSPVEVQSAMADSLARGIRFELVEPGGVEPGLVVSQSPPQGIDPTDTIVVVQIAGAKVPGLAQMKLGDAVVRLVEAKLSLGDQKTATTNTKRKNGLVSKTDPTAGTLLDPGTPVDITVFVFRSTGTPPGKPWTDLRNRLRTQPTTEQMLNARPPSIPRGTMSMQQFQGQN